MRIKLWLERKHPEECSRLRELFSDEQLEYYLKIKEGDFGNLESFGLSFLRRKRRMNKFEYLLRTGEVLLLDRDENINTKLTVTDEFKL